MRRLKARLRAAFHRVFSEPVELTKKSSLKCNGKLCCGLTRYNDWDDPEWMGNFAVPSASMFILPLVNLRRNTAKGVKIPRLSLIAISNGFK